MLEILGCGLSTSAAYTQVFTVHKNEQSTKLNSCKKFSTTYRVATGQEMVMHTCRENKNYCDLRIREKSGKFILKNLLVS